MTRKEIEASEVEKAMDFGTAATGSSKVLPMQDSDLPGFGIGRRKKKNGKASSKNCTD